MNHAHLRLTGGTAKGTRLVSPSDQKIRPMRDRVREALFQMLEINFEDHAAWDFFAGTGALGLGALSRGSPAVHFFDNAPSACNLIRKNLSRTEFRDRGFIHEIDLLDVQSNLFPEEPSPGAVFVSPPYGVFRDPDLRRQLVSLVSHLTESSHLKPGTRVIIESESGDELGRPPGSLVRAKSRTYGRTHLQILRSEEA